jgi:hypothetical protein
MNTMPIARRRRTWYPELLNKFYAEVAQYQKKGYTREAAFREMSGVWGNTPDALSSTYYSHLRKYNATTGAPLSSPSTVSSSKGVSSSKNVSSLEDAINVFKRLGLKVSITF